MDVFLPLLRGVHSTPDSLSERPTVWAPGPSVSEERSPSLPLRVFVALSISLPFGIILRQLPIILLVYHKFRALHVKKKV